MHISILFLSFLTNFLKRETYQIVHASLLMYLFCFIITFRKLMFYVMIPANKEPFLNQLTRVILVHNWYRSTSTCFHVYSREYTCSVCCHEFDTCRTGSELVRFHWYVSSREFTWSVTCLTGETGTVPAVRVFTRIHVFIHVSNWGNWYGSSGTSIHANSRVHTRV